MQEEHNADPFALAEDELPIGLELEGGNPSMEITAEESNENSQTGAENDEDPVAMDESDDSQ